MVLRALAAVCLLLIVTKPGWGQSDYSPPASSSYRDDRIITVLGEGKVGAVAFDVEVGPGRRCDSIQTHIVKQPVDLRKIVLIPGSSWIFGYQSSYGSMTTLVPGDYLIASVFCKTGNNRTNLNGPYASFQVKLGEVVNLGVLRLEYETNLFGNVVGTMKKQVGGMTPEVRAKIKEAFPRAFPKAVERRMTLIGAAEVNIKQR